MSIYVAERPCSQIDAEEAQWNWHHSFLMLVDETEAKADQSLPHFNQGLLELHYYNSENWSMVPVVKPMERSQGEFSTLKFEKIYSGREFDVMCYWNKALAYALDVKGLSLQFDQDYMYERNSNNCRAGIKATVNGIGLQFKRCSGVEMAGMDSDRIVNQSRFDSKEFIDARDLNEAWMHHEYLSERLLSSQVNSYDQYEL